MKTMMTLSVALFCTILSWGQTYNTGDKDFDSNLKTINLEANKDLPQFKLDMAKTYSTTASKINSMFTIGMSAGDIYVALEISTLARKPIDEVMTVYSKSKSKGWGVMAKELGIKPGSAEFHQLKGNCKNKSAKKASGNGNGKAKSNGNGHSNGNGNGKKK